MLFKEMADGYLSVVQLSVNVDLTLCDVSSQIRNWMGDVCKRHTNLFRYSTSNNFVLFTYYSTIIVNTFSASHEFTFKVKIMYN